MFVGGSAVMNFVPARVTLFQGGATEGSLKVRGKTINRAVDVAEITSCRFVKNVNSAGFEIGTNLLMNEGGGVPLNNSIVGIVLAK